MSTAQIEGMPRELRDVPDEPEAYFRWRDTAYLYRAYVRKECESNLAFRAETLKKCAADPCYEMVVMGCVFEPRGLPDRPVGWHPMIPFAFQIRYMRWLQEVMAVQRFTPDALLGRQDGVVEKHRDMSGTWTPVVYACHQWRHADAFTAIFLSYNAEAVEKANDVGTIFHKIEGYLGLDDRVEHSRFIVIDGEEEEIPVRPPVWIVPENFNQTQHNTRLSISHPDKTCLISGKPTTAKTGTGVRIQCVFLDEGAKWRDMLAVWNNLVAVTDHRIVISSPDSRFGRAFQRLADAARRAHDFGEVGPSFIQLLSPMNPEWSEVRDKEIQVRFETAPGGKEAYEREYGLSYEAGGGMKIYPDSLKIEPVHLVFNPATEFLDFCIDPATSLDQCAFHVVSYRPAVDRYGLLLSYSNSGKPADFYASLVVGQPMTQHYEYGPTEYAVIDFFMDYGKKIRTWVGDPAGRHKNHGDRGRLRSYYDDFREATETLTHQRQSISIWSSDKLTFSDLKSRWEALRWLLKNMDFNDDPSTIYTLHALRDYHLKSVDTDREITTSTNEPVRTPGRDRVTALEYYAAARKTDVVVSANGIAKSTRVSMGGKKMAERSFASDRWG